MRMKKILQNQDSLFTLEVEWKSVDESLTQAFYIHFPVATLSPFSLNDTSRAVVPKLFQSAEH